MNDTPNSWHPGPRTDAATRFRPLIFGEALFDHFPDGNRVLGGAPFNVAWHLRGFKTDPLMVTAVGPDDEGKEILHRMGSWGMDPSGVQVHPTRPTGRVTAHLDGGQPSYEIEPRQAYDAIGIEDLPDVGLLDRVHLLYHGTLALRDSISRQTLHYLKGHLDVPVLVDVNLRDPWWNVDDTRAQIRESAWVKVNQDEVGLLTAKGASSAAEAVDAAKALRKDLDLGTVVVTRGDEGALAVSEAGLVQVEAPRVEEIVDTVGAGDAFSAVLALGIHEKWPLDLTLARAGELAAELCRMRGATPEDQDLYARFSRRWSNAH